MINIILSGANGNMGKVIEDCIKKKENMQIVAGVGKHQFENRIFPIYNDFMKINEYAHTIIDFSHPSHLSQLLSYATKNSIPVVIATTGYSLDQIANIKKASNIIPIFFTFNMSIGVNLLVNLAKKATKILGSEFDIEIIEKHHNQKVDSPSGTAIMLADAINETSGMNYTYVYDRHSKRQKRDKKEIGIHSIRGGTIVGEHEVLFTGVDEVLTFSHKAYSKEIFGAGALNATIFLQNKKPGLYSMEDILN